MRFPISRRVLPILLLAAAAFTLQAQDAPDSLAVAESPQAPERTPRFQAGGYIKNLQALLFFNPGIGEASFLQDNFFHHRLNLSYEANPRWRLHAGLRTRLFFGDVVRANPGYAAQIDGGANDWLDLSAVWLDRSGWVGHSVLDRAYAEYTHQRWEVRLGRQRVNWGISSIWNPNDIFNAFAFTDFDYEERPGSDALRVRYFTGFAGSVELAVRGARDPENITAAGRWVFNRKGYDWQLIGGYARRDWVLGGGWAGNLGNAGFKGEWTYFYHLPNDNTPRHNLSATLGIDYVFSNSLYLNGGMLYNSNGSSSAGILNLFNFQLSARNLYPYRWSALLQAGYPLTPLLNTGLALIYSPASTHPVFANPTLSISIADNWNLDAVGQIVMEKRPNNDGYGSPLQAVFLRLKLSY